LRSSAVGVATILLGSAACTQSSQRETNLDSDAALAVAQDAQIAPSDETSVMEMDDAAAAPDGLPEAACVDSCPPDMVLIDGNYCPDVEHHCVQWADAPGPRQQYRCWRYKESTCLSPERTHLRFCIDRYEYTPPGDKLPAVWHSWTTATQLWVGVGKRLCLESEWQFACEGEEMRPYPYGYKRDATACNIDRKHGGSSSNGGLADRRVPAGFLPGCVSPFGVHDMSGNVEEWATKDDVTAPIGHRSTMKGAWWLAGRNHCRAATSIHDEWYKGPQIGVRCCRDAS
jgi:formylglycine-generating enzyme